LRNADTATDFAGILALNWFLPETQAAT